MSVETLEILDGGMLTTVQDRGRFGYQRIGMPVSGAMDVFALRSANRLVGNDDKAAGLELTAVGPKIKFLADTWIAVTGADLSAVLDGAAMPRWRTVPAKAGSMLEFKTVRDGLRAYLAVAGGIDVPLIMGSRSTYLKGAIGGYEGRALKAGDVLPAFGPVPGTRIMRRRLPADVETPVYGHRHELRVVLGPQDDAFTEAGKHTFLQSEYSVSMDMDRMGCKLDGPAIEHESTADIVSDGSPLGAVQVPGDGRPMVLLADRGSTGGYTKIATVISADVDRLGQAMPGDVVTFASIGVDEAHALLREQRAVLDAISASEDVALSVIVDGQSFEVADEAGRTLAASGRDAPPPGLAAHRMKATVGDREFEFDVSVRRLE